MTALMELYTVLKIKLGALYGTWTIESRLLKTELT